MLSSICVATITGLPARRHCCTSRFCKGGSWATGSSTPRSPRATIMPSDSSKIASKSSMAAGFSILEIIAARPLMSVLASITSRARCTNERATQSTPSWQANSRSCRSLVERAGSGSTTSGRLMPLRSEMGPPTSTTVSTDFSVTLVTLRRSLPSLTSTEAPTFKLCKTSGWGRCTRVWSPGVLSVSKIKVWPFSSSMSLLPKVPQRIFGPCRSARIPIGQPSSFSTSRIMSNRCFCSSWVPWLMLRRNTSAPAFASFLMTSWLEEAGPRVATILVFSNDVIHISNAALARLQRGLFFLF